MLPTFPRTLSSTRCLWCVWSFSSSTSDSVVDVLLKLGLRHWCTVGIDRDPPACNRTQGDVTAERQPFVVGVVLKSCGLGRGHHGERCVHSVNC